MSRPQSHADPLAIEQRVFDENLDAKRVYIVNSDFYQHPSALPILKQNQEVRIERVEVPFVVEKEVKEIVYVDRPVIVEKIVTERIEVPVVVRETIIERVEVSASGSSSNTTNIVEKDIPSWVKIALAAQFIISILMLLKK